MKKFKYVFDIAFAVVSTNGADDVTGEELLAGLKARVAYFETRPEELLEACGAASDTYEMECSEKHNAPNPNQLTETEVISEINERLRVDFKKEFPLLDASHARAAVEELRAGMRHGCVFMNLQDRNSVRIRK